jgi:signal transduction histidine kinase
MGKYFLNRGKLIRQGLIGFVALAIALIIGRMDLYYLECFAYDMRVRFSPAPSPSGHIAQIVIDESTVENLKRFPTITEHVRFLENLSGYQPKAVVYLIHPDEISGSVEDFARWAAVTRRFENFFVRINDTALPAEQNKFQLKPPLEHVQVAPGPKTRDRGNFAQDGVTRRMLVSYEGQPMLHTELAKMTKGLRNENEIRGIFPLLGSNQVFIRFHPRGTYKSIPFSEVFAGEDLDHKIRGKYVIVGRDTKFSVDDYVQTPYDRSPLALSELELNSNMLDTLLLNNATIRWPRWVTYFFTAMVSLLTTLIVLTMTPGMGLFVLLATIIGWILLTWAAFLFFGIWIEMVHVLLVIFIGYYFFIPYRLVMENRKTWEYQQRNRLLTQVEELKTNFLSMMSHDIKTPLARIQGMADIVLRESQRLSSAQSEALVTVQKSIDELVDFISSILSLSRIEGKEIQLNLVTKDINALLNEVVSRHQYLAQEKNIQIRCELDPLFSVKLDVDLIRQVFTNLIENAIKYSPPGSRVLISSEESDGQVVVQVADQGIGIAKEELENIFMKFYRSKEVRASTTKGTGLGLYLASYFVELHGGRISVESELGKGSTFTVELPSS